MQPFQFTNSRLHCEGVALQIVADRVGTPVYVYSANCIRDNIQRLRSCFPEADLHYSLKANANLAIIRQVSQSGIGVDAVSGGEIYRAIEAGIRPVDIVFAGVGKTRSELSYALEVGVGWFNVESKQELVLLNELASNHRPARVALRLNPDVAAATHHHIATGHGGAKFGMDGTTVARLLARADDYAHIAIAGIHIHIGSQLGDVVATRQAIEHAMSLAEPYPDVRVLNIGGGFPVNYTEEDEYPTIEAFADMICPLVQGWQLKLEPGRFIVADAGALVVEVLYTKQHFVIVDGSMTELLRPALYAATHPVVPLTQTDIPVQAVTIAGPVCETADVLRYDAMLPPVQPGDRLAILMAGAYGFVMASNYNQRPRPPEVLINDGLWRIIRRRETWADLLRLEDELGDGW